MSEDFIALTTDDFKLTFCQATNALCTDVQRLIWEKAIVTEPRCPPAPRKPATRHVLRNLEKIASRGKDASSPRV